MIKEIEITEIMPNDPNQLSDTYSTKRSLTGKSTPVINPNTIRDSNILLNFTSPEKYLHGTLYTDLLLNKVPISF